MKMKTGHYISFNQLLHKMAANWVLVNTIITSIVECVRDNDGCVFELHGGVQFHSFGNNLEQQVSHHVHH